MLIMSPVRVVERGVICAQGYVDLETRGNTLMVAGSPKYAEVIEATAKRFRDRPERERRRSPSPRSATQHRSGYLYSHAPVKPTPSGKHPQHGMRACPHHHCPGG